MSLADTIFARATGPAVSAIAVVRLSGPKAGAAVEKLTCVALPPPRRFSVRRILDPGDGVLLDEAGVLWMPGPESFTGEDCAELHLHGSQAVVRAILQALGAMDGLRSAEAGEFTRRAFANGKLDLVEIEGLGDLLSAQTESQRRQAMQQLSGASSSVFESWRSRLVDIRALIEASVDFADEEGVAEQASAEVDVAAAGLAREIRRAMAARSAAELVRSGVRVALVGRPNTGKSSLLNALARREAALVSATAGTTRDVISVTLDLDGVAIILSDMAGLREETNDEIELAGIAKARSEIRAADIVIWVCSPDVAGSGDVDPLVTPDLIVVGKSDICRDRSIHIRNGGGTVPEIRLSAVNGSGIADLTGILTGLAHTRIHGGEDALVTNARQSDVLSDVLDNLEKVTGDERMTIELKAEMIRSAADSIGRLTGRIEVEEWLGAIFGRFCIGK